MNQLEPLSDTSHTMVPTLRESREDLPSFDQCRGEVPGSASTIISDIALLLLGIRINDMVGTKCFVDSSQLPTMQIRLYII